MMQRFLKESFMNRIFYWQLALITALAGAPIVLLADTVSLVSEQCASCHQLSDSSVGGDPVARLDRIAPPLHYAGNKYRQDWLEDWLQAPDRIHPAGYLPAMTVRRSEEGDRPDLEALPEHPALDREQAVAVAQYLMGLTSRQSLVEADNYSPGTVALRMGMMDFRRFKGCDACHQDTEDSGGLSGPELHTAWQRLQPAYLSSFIQDPVAWDALTTMPVMSMNEDAVHRIVHYLRMIGEEE